MSQTEVQLIKDAVIVNADISNSAAIDVSKISGAMPLAGGSFTDDVTFTGASSNIVFDKSDNALEFADDAMATFGASADLRIRHNGNNSLIEDMGTGNLQIRGDDVHITGTNDEILAKFIENTGVELYHDGSAKKFETVSTGIQVTGNVKTNGIAQSSGNLSISNNDTSNGVITIATNTNDCWRFEFNGDFEPHVDNQVNIGSSSKRAANVYAVNFYGNGSNLTGISSDLVNDTSPQLGGNLDCNGNNILIDDGNRLHLGNLTSSTGDLQLHHVPADSFSYIDTFHHLAIRKDNGAKTHARFINNAQVELYHNNIKSIETFNTGDAGDSNSTEGSGVKTIGNTGGGTRSNHGYYCYQGSNLVALLANHGSGPEGKLHLFNTGTLNLSMNGTNGTMVLHNASSYIQFGSTNSSAHRLTDYEQGTYTPTVQTNNGVNAGLSTAFGSYVKVGTLVTVHIGVTTNSHSGVNTGQQYRVSLPFTAADQSGVGTEGNLICSQWSIGSQNISWMGGEVQNGFNFIYMHYHNGSNNNTNNLQPSNANNQLHFRGTCVYRTAS